MWISLRFLFSWSGEEPESLKHHSKQNEDSILGKLFPRTRSAACTKHEEALLLGVICCNYVTVLHEPIWPEFPR